MLAYGQIPNSQYLLQLITATTTEKQSITGAQEGMLVFDKDQQAVYSYTSTNGWQKLLQESNVYVGSFIISASGAQTISDLPFKPSSVTFEAMANIEQNNIDSDNSIANNATNIYNAGGMMKGFARDDNGTTVQQVIYNGYSGNSINDISRYASDSNCIGIRYSNQNGDDLGKILSNMTSFNTDGFTITNTYVNGTLTVNTNNPATNIDPAAVQSESIVVIFTAYQ